MATETTEHFDRTAISVLSVAAINPIEIRFKKTGLVTSRSRFCDPQSGIRAEQVCKVQKFR